MATALSQGRQPHKWWALLAVSFGLFMSLLDVTIVNVALPTIRLDTHANFSDLEWVINGYALVFAVVLVTAGRLGDIFGRKKVFIAGLAVFSTGSLLSSLSPQIAHIGLAPILVLNLARGIQGLGASAMTPLSAAIIAVIFHGRERGTAFGIWGAVAGLATAIGPLVGGVLVEKVSWQSIFYLNVPIGVAAILITLWAVPESRDEHSSRRIDIYGLVTLTITMFCLVLALIQGSSKGFGSTYILVLFGIAAVGLLAFIFGELRLKDPMVDLRLFAIRSFTGATVAAFCLSAGLYSLFFYLSLYLQNYMGYSALSAGLRFMPLSAMVLVGAPIAGRFSDRVGPKWILAVGMLLVTVGVLLMARVSGVHVNPYWAILFPAAIVAGIGNGMVNPPLTSVALGAVEPRRSGMASGVNNVCRQIGTAFGIAFLGAVLDNRYLHQLQAKILSIRIPHVTQSVLHQVSRGVSKAGIIAGSEGFRGSGEAAKYGHSALLTDVSQYARASFLHAFGISIWVAGALLAIGFLCTLFFVNNDRPRSA
ncbi:MAG: DHA2 family efflux MFS transporter permease subunit [Alicyclobacillaceae bacterium]|jgi:EmrB/QacA subfamily drug resistance transporter|nr:DHA2 family efflux MFS transporter permease subunit [Alicyclobacillaceae bacterium]